ncbi:MAG TPA: hypothetical protein VN132_05185 [Bdellovibrio sp.]|nr:hypothetical protein [Bdellovibrio sp.]
MKTNLVKLAKAMALAALTLMLANCSKDNGTPSQYVYANGSCIDTQHGNVPVSTTLCAASTTCAATNTQYQWVGNQCYDTYNRIYTTNTALCAQTTNTCVNGLNSCNGTYYYNLGYGTQSISCSSNSTVYYSSSYQTGYAGQVYNCRGLSLYQMIGSGYQLINCQ